MMKRLSISTICFALVLQTMSIELSQVAYTQTTASQQSQPTKQSGTPSTASALPSTHQEEAQVADEDIQKVRRITTTELKEALQQGNVIVVDVRREEGWRIGHIRGAKSIPKTDVASRANELDRNKLIVTYCGCPKEKTAAIVAIQLEKLGFNKTAALLGGIRQAAQDGIPIVGKTWNQ
jgi:rhodanese-related sulfurtransferase